MQNPPELALSNGAGPVDLVYWGQETNHLTELSEFVGAKLSDGKGLDPTTLASLNQMFGSTVDRVIGPALEQMRAQQTENARLRDELGQLKLQIAEHGLSKLGDGVGRNSEKLDEALSRLQGMETSKIDAAELKRALDEHNVQDAASHAEFDQKIGLLEAKHEKVLGDITETISKLSEELAKQKEAEQLWRAEREKSDAEWRGRAQAIGVLGSILIGLPAITSAIAILSGALGN